MKPLLLPTIWRSEHDEPLIGQALRNRIAARMLLAGILPVAVIFGLRFFWKDVLGQSESHPSYDVLTASLVLILSATLASYFSRGMIVLLRGTAKDRATGDVDPVLEAVVDEDSPPPAQPAGEIEAAFACLLASGSDAVLLVDHSEGIVRSASRRFREVFGFERDIPESLHYSEVKTRLASRFSDPKRFEETWARLASSGARIEGESWRTAGPESRSFVVSSEPLPTPGRAGDGGYRIWIFVEITEEIALRAELNRAQRLESIGALAGGVAHDFNNMLTGVMGNLALAEIEAEKEGGIEAERPHLDRARQAGMRAVELARHLISYSSGCGEKARIVEVGRVVRDVEALLRPGLESSLDFRVEIGEGIGSITGEAAEIEQILVSLCIDARSALHGHAEGTLELVARVSEGEGGDVELIVRDNRVSGPSECGEKLMEIARQNGGALSRGRNDKGAFVSVFSIPRTEEVANEEAVGASRKISTVRDGFGCETVMIVDDEEVVRMVGEKMLRNRGYLVRSASDGRDALEQFDAAPQEIDLVLLDLTMPNLSGSATFRMLKARDATLPVIICSGYLVDAEAFEMENGWRPDGIIAKPYSIESLSSEVRRVLDGNVGVFLDAGI
jgi:two-component system cell cycle sensor histidine kinase/response regulator CckA